MSLPTSEDPPRRYPRTLGGLVYLAVVAMAAIGLSIVIAGPWRTGVSWIGVGLLVGAAARTVLTEHAAGMLRVRRRWSDVVTLAVAGAGLIVLAVVVPDQPG
ncbi:hypothetical protein BH18ACT9_BH18ACT9_11450 [soil metagenome]